MIQKHAHQAIETALEILKRRQWLAIITFCGVMAVAVGLAIFLPSVYTASALILVERQQVPEAYVKPTVTTGVESRVQTIRQEILSQSRLEGLIKKFDLYPALRKQVPMEEVVERMRKDIALDIRSMEQKGPNRSMVAFTISYTGRHPEKVRSVTNALASFFIEENLKVRERQASSTTEFLQAQLDEVKKKLESQEKAVSQYKERYMGELPQQQEANLKTLARLQEQMARAVDGQVKVQAQYAALVKQIEEASSPAGGRDAIAARVAKLNQALTELQTRFSDKYPDIVQIKQEIALLEEQMAKADGEEMKKLRLVAEKSPYGLKLREELRKVDVEAKALTSEVEHLKRTTATYQRRVENAPRREQELSILTRDYETTRELYTSLLKRLDEARLAESMEQRQKGEQFKLLDAATLPETPTGPNRLRLLLIGLVLAVGTTIGALVLAEQLDTSFHKVEDLRAEVQAPVLVSISKIVTEKDLLKSRRARWVGATVTAIGLFAVFGLTSYFAIGNDLLTSVLTSSTIQTKAAK